MNTSNITNYKPKDFAELLGVSVKTLQRWDREGTLKANRTPTDRRYYTYDQYIEDYGSGLNYNRKKWNELLDEVMEQKIKTIIVKDCICERHRINIPTLSWVRIKEKGYIPTTKDGYIIKSGSVSIKADKFYVS